LGADPVESVRDLFGRLEFGDASAIETVEATSRLVALALTALEAIVDPELVVLGGSIGIRPELVDRVRSSLRFLSARSIDIRVSALGARAALVGAISLAVNRLHNDLFGMSGVPKELSVPGAVTGRAAA
jgi:predicted NBD/HSP70 family sugar kinase